MLPKLPRKTTSDYGGLGALLAALIATGALAGTVLLTQAPGIRSSPPTIISPVLDFVMRESTKEATNKAPLVTDSAKQRTIPNNASAITKSSSSAGNGSTTYSATIAHHFSRARTLAWTTTETNSTGSNVSSAPLMLSSGSLLSGGAALESGAAGTSLQILAPDADISWTGATSSQWSTSTNWSSNTIPGNLDNALFDGLFANQPNLTASATVGGLWMKATVGQDVTISGAPPHLLSLVGNTIGGNPNLGILIDSGAAFSLTIDCDIKVINSQTWLNNNSSELFTVNGGVNVNGQTLTIDGAGDTKITGVISGGAPSSSLHKSGSGTMTLTGANTYQGETVVTGGTLFVNGDQSNAHGNVTVSNSGTTLGGTGIIGGPVTVNSGANIAPGRDSRYWRANPTTRLQFSRRYQRHDSGRQL